MDVGGSYVKVKDFNSNFRLFGAFVGSILLVCESVALSQCRTNQVIREKIQLVGEASHLDPCHPAVLSQRFQAKQCCGQKYSTCFS